jgi:hypothetical protein
MEQDFLKPPTPAALYFTLMVPCSPDFIRSFGQFVVVQSQLTITLFIIKDTIDVFVNSNVQLLSFPFGITPRSIDTLYLESK